MEEAVFYTLAPTACPHSDVSCFKTFLSQEEPALGHSLGSASNRLPMLSTDNSGTEMPPSCRTHLPFPSGHLHLSFSLGGSTERCRIFYSVKMKPVVMVWLEIPGWHLTLGPVILNVCAPDFRSLHLHMSSPVFTKKGQKIRIPFLFSVCSSNSSLKETGILSS